MKKLQKTAAAAAIMIASSLTVFHQSAITVSAKEDYSGYYPMACSAYEVDTVTDNGQFSSQGCYDDYESALVAMKQYGNDGVVRHPESYSPSKVIAMGAGVVYSYPQRSGSNTARVFQDENYSGALKNTYITVHREMSYEETLWYDGSSGTGRVHVVLNGFDGYIDLINVDLVPMKFVTAHQKIWLGGNSTYDWEEPFLTYIYQGYFEVEKNGNYTDLVYHCHSGYSLNDPVEWKFTIGPAADWMKTGDVYYSKDGYNLYSDRFYKNHAGVYYSYYQFQPLRTRSHIPAEVFDRYLEQAGRSDGVLYQTGQIFLDAQEEYGINAALMFGMACMESGFGTSAFARQRNNLFGVAAYDSDPGRASYFESVEQAIRQQMGINMREYTSVNDARFFGAHLGNKGSGINVKYAGDNYWGMKIAAIAYDLDKCSKSYDGTLTDYNTAKLGVIVNDYNVNVRSGNSTDTAVLYNTTFGDYDVYQQNFTVSITDEKDGWYQVQSNNYLENGTVKMIAGEGYLTWDWEAFRGWIRSDLVTVIANGTLTPPSAAPSTPKPQLQKSEKSLFRTIDSVGYSDESTVRLSGIAFIEGMDASSSADIKASVIAVNMETGDETYFNAAMSDMPDALVTGDGHDYTKIAYSADINTADLVPGNYYLKMRMNNSGTEMEKLMITNKESADQQPRTVNGWQVSVNAAPLSNYRMEICIEKSGLDRTVVSKPTRRASTFGGSFILDGSTLKLDGFGIIHQTDMSASSNPSVSLILMDENGEVFRTGGNQKACTADLAAMNGSSYNLDHACFDVSYDLNALPAGTYRILLDMTSDSSRDIFEAYSMRETEPVESSAGNRTYRIESTKVRGRYILTVTQ